MELDSIYRANLTSTLTRSNTAPAQLGPHKYVLSDYVHVRARWRQAGAGGGGGAARGARGGASTACGTGTVRPHTCGRGLVRWLGHSLHGIE